MTILEKVAYLKGLTEGLGVEENSREGKLWTVLNDILSDIAHELDDLSGDFDVTGDSEDWKNAWNSWADDDGENDFGSEPAEEEPEDEEEGEYAEDGEEDDGLIYDGIVYDVKCPRCGEEISFDDETLAEGFIICPGCGEKLEFDLDED